LQSDKDSSYLSSSKLWNSDDTTTEEKEETAFDKVASKGLAGVLAIAVAESIFWALGVPLAALWYKYTTGVSHTLSSLSLCSISLVLLLLQW
jgi:hypothetical protein